MALSEEERIRVQARLDEARDALHRLELGQAEASIAYNGESVTYTQTNAGSLRKYVRDLEVQLGFRSMARARSRGVVFG
ncbi:gpW family head-tail joining protein [Shinella sp. M31]|uniref:gpW family head-tail joining protein n=1 Tax=Shinella sp. M31 TaxID=3368615 RepID=UPI003BA1F4DE